LILDTHVLIWWAQKSQKLSSAAIEIIEAAPEVYFSAASIFEMEIKRPKIPSLPKEIASEFSKFGFLELSITASHAAEVGNQDSLVGHDLFDRLLIAQAEATGFKLLTSDSKLNSLGIASTISI
jgi:PIN domain nuclease of toxin-antitoxin system